MTGWPKRRSGAIRVATWRHERLTGLLALTPAGGFNACYGIAGEEYPMKKVVTVIVALAALLSLAAFASPGVAQQKAQAGMQQPKSHPSGPVNSAAAAQSAPKPANRPVDDCSACRKWCTSRCVQDPGSDCMCIRSDPN
jgi:hypothetical protein